jgi:RNA polymerase sigma-70 factor (ECF subfamily)
MVRLVATAEAPAAGSGEAADDVVHLVQAAQRQDRAAFAELYALYARTVHGILLSRVPRADVDDLVQDVFLQAMQRLPELRQPSAFSAWLAAIARNRATDYFRHAAPTAELPDEVPANDPDRTEAMAVMAIIRTLPEAYRETLTLRLVEGLTGPEIAARTGLTEGSVRVNLHRGMKQLRERLERRPS